MQNGYISAACQQANLGVPVTRVSQTMTAVESLTAATTQNWDLANQLRNRLDAIIRPDSEKKPPAPEPLPYTTMLADRIGSATDGVTQTNRLLLDILDRLEL